MLVEQVAIDRIIPYEKNPRRNAAAVPGVVAALREFGWRQPIVVDADMVIVVGHTRRLAALELGMTEVPVHIARDLTPEQLRAYRIADNRTGEDAEWDTALLHDELVILTTTPRPSLWA